MPMSKKFKIGDIVLVGDWYYPEETFYAIVISVEKRNRYVIQDDLGFAYVLRKSELTEVSKLERAYAKKLFGFNN